MKPAKDGRSPQPNRKAVMNETATDSRTHVAKNVRRLRRLRGWSQTDLAKQSGVAQTVISYLERPQDKSPTLDTLQAVADALDIPAWTLLIENNGMSPDSLAVLDQVAQAFSAVLMEGRQQIHRTAEAEMRYVGFVTQTSKRT
jgi:transcriptional regulator with XRE-family HTH domain